MIKINLNENEQRIVGEILKIKDSINITIRDIFLQIIENSKDEIKYQNENNEYTFKDKDSIKYLILITCTLKKLINNNLLLLLDKRHKSSTLIFLDENGEMLSNLMILEIKDILNNYIYITDDLRNLFEPSFLKRAFICSPLLLSIIFFIRVYFFLEQKLIRYIYIFGIFLIIVLSVLRVHNYKKKLIIFWNYPYLNTNTLNTILTVWGFIITTLSLVISIISLIISIKSLH